MATQDRRCPQPGQPRRRHVELAPDRHRRAAGNAEKPWAAEDSERDHRGSVIAGEDGDDHQQDDDARHGEHEVREAYDDPIEPAAAIAGGNAERDTDG